MTQQRSKSATLIAALICLLSILVACSSAVSPSETNANNSQDNVTIPSNDTAEWEADSQPETKQVVMEPVQPSYPAGTFLVRFTLTATEPGTTIQYSTDYSVYRLEEKEKIFVTSFSLDDAATATSPTPDGYAQTKIAARLTDGDEPPVAGTYRVYFTGIDGLTLFADVVIEP